MRYNARFLDKSKDDWNHDHSVLKINVNPHLLCSDQRTAVLIYEHDTPILLLNICVEVSNEGYALDSCFNGFLSNNHYIAIILGQYVHLVDILSKQVKSLYLADFVGHIYAVPNCIDNKLSDNFIITTYRYVFLINITKGIVWKSNMCGIDGVIITNIHEGVIYGKGEWAPPSEWVDFRLSLNNGATIKIS